MRRGATNTEGQNRDRNSLTGREFISARWTCRAFFFVVLSQAFHCNCNAASLSHLVVLFVVKRGRPQTRPQIKGCGLVRSVASFSVSGRDNSTVCGTHVPQQSTEQPFEEAPSHGCRGPDTIRHSVTPASAALSPPSNSHSSCWGFQGGGGGGGAGGSLLFVTHRERETT